MAVSLPAFLNRSGFSLTNKRVAALRGGVTNRPRLPEICTLCPPAPPLQPLQLPPMLPPAHPCLGDHAHLARWPGLRRCCVFDHHTCNAWPGSCYQAGWRIAENSLLFFGESTASKTSKPAANLNKKQVGN